MKQGALVLFLCLTALLLCSCTFFSGEYRSVNTHIPQDQPSTSSEQKETPSVVRNRTELRGEVLSFVRDWRESGEIRMREYQGNPQEDLPEVLRYLTEEDPVGAYAVDYAEAEIDGSIIRLRIVFRRSASEIDAIVTVNDLDGACDRIFWMLENNRSSLTLRIGKYEAIDFEQTILEYCLTHLGSVAAIPTISAQLYPDSGSIRILELHLSYPAPESELQENLRAANVILASANQFLSEGQSDAERLSLLYRFLKNRFDRYTVCSDTPLMPAYSLLCLGEIHRLSLAAFCGYECALSFTSAQCTVCSGTYNGEYAYWNAFVSENGTPTLYFDLFRALESGDEVLHLYTYEEMLAMGYRPGSSVKFVI